MLVCDHHDRRTCRTATHSHSEETMKIMTDAFDSQILAYACSHYISAVSYFLESEHYYVLRFAADGRLHRRLVRDVEGGRTLHVDVYIDLKLGRGEDASPKWVAGINWPGCGTVDSAQARVFKELITEALELSDAMIFARLFTSYNGVPVTVIHQVINDRLEHLRQNNRMTAENCNALYESLVDPTLRAER